MKIAYELSVKVSSYTDREGTVKNKYMNVGRILEKEDGGQFIIMDRTFNPAGCPNPDNKSSVIISMFEPRDKEEKKPYKKEDHGPDNYEDNPFSDSDIPY